MLHVPGVQRSTCQHARPDSSTADGGSTSTVSLGDVPNSLSLTSASNTRLAPIRLLRLAETVARMIPGEE